MVVVIVFNEKKKKEYSSNDEAPVNDPLGVLFTQGSTEMILGI